MPDIPCNRTCGSSGGPWLRDHGPGNHADPAVHGPVGQSCTTRQARDLAGPPFASDTLALCNAEGGRVGDRSPASYSFISNRNPMTR